MASYALDFVLVRENPWHHQKIGVKKIFENKAFFLADEMGAGKTKQAIDAVQFLAMYGFVEKVIVICPASVRSVWFDPKLGELAKHLWEDTSSLIMEYHSKSRIWEYNTNLGNPIKWLITNYDYVRDEGRQREIIRKVGGDKTILILDESSKIKNWKAKQTKACRNIRHACARVLLLNGTPIGNNPGDLYSQAEIMDPRILGCKSWFHFRARYAVMGGWQNKQIVKWINLEDLQQRLAPYIIRRLKADCMDLPEKMPPVTISVPLSEPLWKIYKEMRDELVAWLDKSSVSLASQAVVKAMRLAQITSGFLGGVEEQPEDENDESPIIPFTREVGREKLDAFLKFYSDLLEEDENLKLLTFGRFKSEVRRALTEVMTNPPIANLQAGLIIGGQKTAEREYAQRLLNPETMPAGPAVVFGTTPSGSLGLQLQGAHHVIYLSNDYSLLTRKQSEDRAHRGGQIHRVNYFDFVATGPQGQRTIDHDIIKTLRNRDNLAERTNSAWVKALMEE
jgi:hypothetical protein